MKFCSACGQSVVLEWLAHEGRERFVCQACGLTHYQNPRVIVGCFAYWRDKVVFCRRADPPDAGTWMIPSGFLEHGETLQAGAARETFEECGVAVDPAHLDLYAVWSMPSLGQVGVSFRTALQSEPMLCPGPECLEVALFSESEVPFDNLAWRDTAINPIRLFFSQLRTGRFGIHLRELGANGDGESGLRAYPATAHTPQRP